MFRSALQKLFVLVVILGVLVPFRGAVSQSETSTSASQIYLPLIFKNYPPLALTDIWVGNAGGYERSAFRPGESIRYITIGENNSDTQLDVELRWQQAGPCGATEIYKGTLSLEPGLWADVIEESAPTCLGTYTNSVELTYESFKFTETTTFDVVNYTSEIVISDKHGFDKCGLPTVEQMQTWWLESPYWVFNIYLGGSSFACDNPGLTSDWVWQVSQQGWDFILTWVGPQSPCFTTSKPKISYDETLAYQQGQDEADLAIAAADNLGLNGDKIIYYDLEAYTDTTACRNAVDAFITGWTARLHEQGLKAGAYGTPCTSYIGDWWNNNPRLDDIWFARWSYSQYNPDASVDNNVCTLTADMWPNQQRIRQYAGDHSEVWGNLYIGSIDSNVLLGEITAIKTIPQSSLSGSILSDQPFSDPLLREAQLLTPDFGWALQANQLLQTADAGKSWQVITPPDVETILSVDFADNRNGWVVAPDSMGELRLQQTRDGGVTWQVASLPTFGPETGAVYLDLVDAQTGWLTLKLVSSSSFSRGQLFVTQDGGKTWEERPVPLGEPVQFSDAQHGWVAGGPTGEEFYRTEDGGRSWIAIDAQDYLRETATFQSAHLPENAVLTSWADAQNAWALTQTGDCAGEKNPIATDEPLHCWQQTQLLMTTDGGQTWQEITPLR